VAMAMQALSEAEAMRRLGEAILRIV